MYCSGHPWLRTQIICYNQFLFEAQLEPTEKKERMEWTVEKVYLFFSEAFSEA